MNYYEGTAARAGYLKIAVSGPRVRTKNCSRTTKTTETFASYNSSPGLNIAVKESALVVLGSKNRSVAAQISY